MRYREHLERIVPFYGALTNPILLDFLRNWIFWATWNFVLYLGHFSNFLGHFEFFRPLWILDHLKFLQFLLIFAVLALVAGPRLHTCWIVTALVIWLHFHSMMFTLARWRNHYLVNSEIDLWWPYMHLLASFPNLIRCGGLIKILGPNA